MKGFALLLLCAVAAVQGRSANNVQVEERALATLGENPWVVHLRLATATSGLLNSCAGSLIHSRFVLTSAECVRDARFIWVRYGVVTVVNPELVTETSSVSLSPLGEAAIVNLNRAVQPTPNIGSVSRARDTGIPDSGRFCGFGETREGNAGERMACFNVSLERSGDKIIAYTNDGQFSRFDNGAPLVVEGVQIGIFSGLIGTRADGNVAHFESPVAHNFWIDGVTGQ